MTKPTFSTEDIQCNTVLECLYSLTDMDNRVLSFLRKGGEYRAKEVAARVDRDQSTAYRSLEKLVECGLAYKEKHNIRNGGYFFLYSARPLDLVKRDALECLEQWYERMRTSIENLEDLTD